MTTQDVTAISEYKLQLATVTDMSDIRRILSIAKGLVEATTKEYERAKNNHGIEQTKAIKEAAFENAIKAGELRLLAEARFREMIKRFFKSDEIKKREVKQNGDRKQISS